MVIASLTHSLLPLISFLTSFSLFILFLSLLLKTHNAKKASQAEKSSLCQTEPPLTLSTEEEPPKEEDKKRRKRGRKKRQEPTLSESGDEPQLTKSTANVGDGKVGTLSGTGSDKANAGTRYPLFPFSSVTSSLQKRIKSNYDEILKTATQTSNAVTVPQVSEFIDCLVEARNELQHRSGQIQRSYKIRKALLSTANKSSFDRLWDEVHKLEKEHKRLEADAAVFNVLQEQLKLSPAYKTLHELSVKMEKEAQNEQMEDFPDISFEELLAQEKRDSFWQSNGKMRSFPK